MRGRGWCVWTEFRAVPTGCANIWHCRGKGRAESIPSRLQDRGMVAKETVGKEWVTKLIQYKPVAGGGY